MYLSYLTLLSSTALDDIYNALQLTILQINIPAQAYRDSPSMEHGITRFSRAGEERVLTTLKIHHLL